MRDHDPVLMRFRHLPLFPLLIALWLAPAGGQQANPLEARVAALGTRLDGQARRHLLDDQDRWERSRQAACAAGLLEAAECHALLQEDRIALIEDISRCPRYPFVGARALIETANRSRFHVYAAYPGFDGATADFAPLNRGIREFVSGVITGVHKAAEAATDKDDFYGYHQVYRLHCLSDAAIGLEFHTYAYGGTAHPEHRTIAFVVDLRSGGILSPDQLFAADSHWRAQVTSFVLHDLERQLHARGNGGSLPPAADMARRMSEDRRYVFRRGKLVVVFDSGEIPPYSDGPRAVEIPYPVLRPFLAPGAPLAD